MNFTRSQSRKGGNARAQQIRQNQHAEAIRKSFEMEIVSVETEEQYNKYSGKMLTFRYGVLSCGHRHILGDSDTAKRYCPDCDRQAAQK